MGRFKWGRDGQASAAETVDAAARGGFSVESWFWQGCIALGRQIVARIPWAALKAQIAAAIAKLPAPVVLIVFLIPVAIVEPLQTLCVYLIARGHLLPGIVGFVALKFFGLGLIAVIFDLTREKLLSMPWFAWVYAKFVAFNAFAHDLIAPYKEAVMKEMRALRRRARAYWVRLRAGRAEARGGDARSTTAGGLSGPPNGKGSP